MPKDSVLLSKYFYSNDFMSTTAVNFGNRKKHFFFISAFFSDLIYSYQNNLSIIMMKVKQIFLVWSRNKTKQDKTRQNKTKKDER